MPGSHSVSWLGKFLRAALGRSETLLELVERELAAPFEERGLRLSRLAARWPNGPIDLEVGDVTIRLVREGPFCDALFASSTDPDTSWFGSDEVMECLGLGTEGIADFDRATTVARLRDFLHARLGEVVALFARESYADGKRRLMATRRAKADRIAPARGRRL